MTDNGVIAASSRIDLARTPPFLIGALRVIPAELAVERDAQRRELQPRVLQVLVALADSRPEVVSRDRLVERCWDGRIVGDDAINRCILALRHMADEFEPAPFMIETIPRIGYRLIETPGAARVPASGVWEWLRRYRIALAVVIAAAVLGLGILGWQQRPTADAPARIAVLPFRNLSGGDPYFAQGLGEEILGQLGRDPGFQVAGRTSADRFRDAVDLRQAGKALGVDYLLEGSVRRDNGRIQVDASLVDASNGLRMWSQRFDRNEGDVFAVQQAIGAAVTQALHGKLVASAQTPGPATSKAYPLYLEARGMLRTRNPQMAHEASGLLRLALAADPNFAPAWAAQADAIRLDSSLQGQEQVIAALPEARAAARRALALDPNLAEAHGVLGTLLGFTSPEAQAHLRRAAQLDPRDAQAQLWLGSAARVSGDYAGEIAAYRRANSLDPEWFRPVRDLALAMAEMGQRREAEALVRESPTAKRAPGMAPIARIAWTYGDIAQAMQQWSAGKTARDSIWNAPEQVHRSVALYRLGLKPAPEPPLPMIELRNPQGMVFLREAPSPAVWQRQNRDADAALVYRYNNVVGAKLMLAAGRARELVATWRGPGGLLGVHRGDAVAPSQLHTVALVALALRSGGEPGEAERLLREASSLGARLTGKWRVPFPVTADLAGVEAAAGHADRALALLSEAMQRGWVNNGTDDLPKFADEPAFGPISGDPRFAAAAARLDALYARERAKTLALKLPGVG